MWGGLQIIASRLFLDVIGLLGLSYSILSEPRWINAAVMVSTGVLTFTTAGFTSRWTLTFPMMAIFGLQFLRRLILIAFCPKNKIIISNGNATDNDKNTLESSRGDTRRPSSSIALNVIKMLSILITLIAAVFTLWCFPPLELPRVQGPYNVGVVDFYLPVGVVFHSNTQPTSTTTTCKNNNDTETCRIVDENVDNDCSSGIKDYVSVRLLYPTNDDNTVAPSLSSWNLWWSNKNKNKSHPYLKPNIAMEFCKQFMKAGGPPPLKEFGWLLHYWLLTHTDAQRNAPLLTTTTGDDKQQHSFPLVVFSHGLVGNSDIYSYQTMALAAKGIIVLVVEHKDGSAPVVQNHDGSFVTFDHDVKKVESKEEYERLRRERTDLRVQEVIAATEAFRFMTTAEGQNNRNTTTAISLPELDHVLLDGSLQLDPIIFMGHSYGGATALTAGKRRPDLATAVIAHEPAIGWVPDDTRASLFSQERLVGIESSHNLTEGITTTTTTTTAHHDNDTATSSVHDLNLLLLFSEEWKSKGWGLSHILDEMNQKGKLGTGVSDFGVISGAHHVEFSDIAILTPLWIGRGAGITGKQSNPLESAKDIERRTWSFIQSVLTQQKQKS